MTLSKKGYEETVERRESMSKRKIQKGISVAIGMVMALTSLTGCTQSSESGKVEVELVSYKPEAVDVFEEIAERFNATHEDIHLTIDSPNEAMTILKTRFIREDYPDIVGIGEISIIPISLMQSCSWISQTLRKPEWSNSLIWT